MNEHPLGRRKPPDRKHIAAYPLSSLIEDPTTALLVPPWGVEKGLGLPSWWTQSDQKAEGSCVGWGCSHMMSITNSRQAYVLSGIARTYRYMPRWLWQQARLVDEWTDNDDLTDGDQGTSVRAGCQILREVGHRRVVNRVGLPPSMAEGVSAYRWATTVDEMRAAIFGNLAISIGVNWYENFDSPKAGTNGELWIGVDNAGRLTDRLGQIRGGHCICLYRMSDSRGAFRAMNSWGSFYPPVWIPYSLMQHLLDEDGEAAVVTDR